MYERKIATLKTGRLIEGGCLIRAVTYIQVWLYCGCFLDFVFLRYVMSATSLMLELSLVDRSRKNGEVIISTLGACSQGSSHIIWMKGTSLLPEVKKHWIALEGLFSRTGKPRPVNSQCNAIQAFWQLGCRAVINRRGLGISPSY